MMDGHVQSNQFLITHTGADGVEEGLLFDPGGTRIVPRLLQEVAKFISTNRIRKLVLSHQDPDTGSGATIWLMLAGSNIKIYVSHLWIRFVPHYSPGEHRQDMFVPIPDNGMKLDLADSCLHLVPAHFLHSPGNFQIYDPVSKILFSGDLGSSFVPGAAFGAVSDFEDHLQNMEWFHKRYMASNAACRTWARMARGLDIEAIVPQHGLHYFKGKATVNRFIDWLEGLQCGADHLNAAVDTVS